MGFLVGLTGGIGSGKSAVEKLFSDRGVPVIDTDVIAHELTGINGAAMPAIATAFGTAVLSPDGALDRFAMRRFAFADADVRQRLEGILHPMIRHEALARCQQALSAHSPYVILSVPLLVESGNYRQIVQQVLVVDCEETVQIKRVMARSGLTVEEVRRIMSVQASRAERLAAADDIIDNNGDLKALAPQVESLHRRYLALSASGGEHSG